MNDIYNLILPDNFGKKARDYINQQRKGNSTVKQICGGLGISQRTYYRYLKIMDQQNQLGPINRIDNFRLRKEQKQKQQDMEK